MKYECYLRTRHGKSRLLFQEMRSLVGELDALLFHEMQAHFKEDGVFRVSLERSQQSTHISRERIADCEQVVALVRAFRDEEGTIIVEQAALDGPEETCPSESQKILASAIAKQAEDIAFGTATLLFVALESTSPSNKP